MSYTLQTSFIYGLKTSRKLSKRLTLFSTAEDTSGPVIESMLRLSLREATNTNKSYIKHAIVMSETLLPVFCLSVYLFIRLFISILFCTTSASHKRVLSDGLNYVQPVSCCEVSAPCCGPCPPV